MTPLDLTHKLVLNPLFADTYDGVGYSCPTCYYMPLTETRIREWMDEKVDGWASEDYDVKPFAVMATPSIRDTLDYDLLMNVWEEMSWEMFVYELFCDDEDDDAYWENYNSVFSRVECDWD